MNHTILQTAFLKEKENSWVRLYQSRVLHDPFMNKAKELKSDNVARGMTNIGQYIVKVPVTISILVIHLIQR